jgi:hypothetical protein
MDKELERLNIELKNIENDIDKGRKNGTDLNYLFKEKQDIKARIASRQTEIDISNPPKLDSTKLSHPQIVLSTSSVRRKHI